MNMVKLEEINLSENDLTHLDKDLFAKNLKLIKVNLEQNRLNEIEVDFTKLSSLKLVDLTRNKCVDTKYGGLESDSTMKNVTELQALIRNNCEKKL